MDRADSHILVIFGASGDLTKRKLIPAIFELYCDGMLPDKFAVLGSGRSEMSDTKFRDRVVEMIPESPERDKFVELLFYQPLSTAEGSDFTILKDRLEALTTELSITPNYIFYLSTPPVLYSIIPRQLAEVGLNDDSEYFRRLIVEKPFGTDLESALALNETILSVFKECQIYRIDHYLGKETVQNLLVLRFSNSIFEPIWNRNYIERVEVTSSESLGVEDRGGYYDSSGALRDMIQNHLLQLVGLVAMEPPVVVDADAIRNETLKVFQSLQPIAEKDVAKSVVRGQYIASKVGGKELDGYREADGVDDNSKTETFAAVKFFIDNWRWGGVPFYIRSGKRLPTRVTEVVIHFKPSPHHLFDDAGSTPINNQLIIRIQPDEGILLKFGVKEPGSGFTTKPVNMDFHYNSLSDSKIPAAYERLIHDCMIGDATLYSRGDAVMEAWRFVKPIQDAWSSDDSIPIYGYPSGTWGPNESDELIDGDSTWRYPCKNLVDDGLYCEL